MDPGTRHEIPRPEAAKDPERRIVRTDTKATVVAVMSLILIRSVHASGSVYVYEYHTPYLIEICRWECLSSR